MCNSIFIIDIYVIYYNNLQLLSQIIFATHIIKNKLSQKIKINKK